MTPPNRCAGFHDRLITAAFETNSGQVVKQLGDGLMAVFSGAVEAVTAALAAQARKLLVDEDP